jgi:hypothetical protein
MSLINLAHGGAREAPAMSLAPEAISGRIAVVRGERVLLDADLALLYGVTTKRLNEQIRRNPARFPDDFVFRLTNQEVANLRSRFATSSLRPLQRWGGRRYAPLAFTEHGALMAASVLNAPRAVEVSVYVVRAFVRLRAVLAAHAALTKKLDDVERKTEALVVEHDALAASTRAQFKQVLEALRALTRPPDPARRPIGFVTPEERKSR